MSVAAAEASGSLTKPFRPAAGKPTNAGSVRGGASRCAASSCTSPWSEKQPVRSEVSGGNSAPVEPPRQKAERRYSANAERRSHLPGPVAGPHHRPSGLRSGSRECRAGGPVFHPVRFSQRSVCSRWHAVRSVHTSTVMPDAAGRGAAGGSGKRIQRSKRRAPSSSLMSRRLGGVHSPFGGSRPASGIQRGGDGQGAGTAGAQRDRPDDQAEFSEVGVDRFDPAGGIGFRPEVSSSDDGVCAAPSSSAGGSDQQTCSDQQRWSGQRWASAISQQYRRLSCSLTGAAAVPASVGYAGLLVARRTPLVPRYGDGGSASPVQLVWCRRVGGELKGRLLVGDRQPFPMAMARTSRAPSSLSAESAPNIGA